MRTVFVNPRRRRRSSKRRRRRNASLPATSNPRRRRRRRRNYSAAMQNPRRRRRSYRRRRRNSGVAPFVQANPLILSNPRRRRRRHNPKLNIKSMLNNLLVYGGGGVLGYGVNQFALSHIDNNWVRRGAQAGTAILGAYFMRGELGAAFAGATMYPLIADLAMFSGLVAVPTQEDLNELSADLEGALLEADLQDDELYIEDDEEETVTAW